MEGFHEGKDKEKNTGREAKIKRLREELEDAIEQMEDEFSLERIDELTGELERLEGAEGDFDVKQAKAEFFQKYYPLTEEWEEQNRQRTHKGRQRGQSRQSRLGRRMKAAMVLAAAFLCLNGATVAIAGMNLFEAIFQWDEETFRIGTAEGHVEIPAGADKTAIFSEEGTAWAELEADFGAEIPLIGAFADMEITRMEQMRKNIVDIDFSDGENDYYYSIQNLKYGHANMIVEKTEEEPIEYNLDGITYYFVQNRRWMTIVWQYENQIYTITGDFDEEQAKTIVESIQYEEE
ncbi:DUF4367 domain-containing protein [Anaerotignum sp.]